MKNPEAYPHTVAIPLGGRGSSRSGLFKVLKRGKLLGVSLINSEDIPEDEYFPLLIRVRDGLDILAELHINPYPRSGEGKDGELKAFLAKDFRILQEKLVRGNTLTLEIEDKRDEISKAPWLKDAMLNLYLFYY